MAFLGNLTSRLEKDLKTAFGATVAHGSMAVPSAGTIPFPSQETDLKLKTRRRLGHRLQQAPIQSCGFIRTRQHLDNHSVKYHIYVGETRQSG